jgi:hypothetical protein
MADFARRFSGLSGLFDGGDALLDVAGGQQGGAFALDAALQAHFAFVTRPFLSAFGAMAHVR